MFKSCGDTFNTVFNDYPNAVSWPIMSVLRGLNATFFFLQTEIIFCFNADIKSIISSQNF